ISSLQAIGDAITVEQLNVDRSLITILAEPEVVVVKMDDAITDEMKKLMEEQRLEAEQAQAQAQEGEEVEAAGTEGETESEAAEGGEGETDESAKAGGGEESQQDDTEDQKKE